MHQIFHLVHFKTNDDSKLYHALSTQSGLAGWWTKETKAGPNIGSIASFRFTDTYHKEMKITRLDENVAVEWECVHGDAQWLGTKIEFLITKKESGLVLRFRHSGWKEQTDLFAECNYQWARYLKSLKNLIETGSGQPHDPSKI